MSAARALLAALCLLAPILHASGQTKSALLIGIDTYQPANTTVKAPPGVNTGRFAPGAPRFNNLSGPTYDVASLRAVLTSSKFGFPNDDQHIHVLENGAATREGILAAMNKYLVEQPQKGDIVVLYVAGHGSLRVNSKSNKQTFDIAGKPTALDNTIVPADAYLGTEDIRDREMARIFNKAVDKGIRLTAIFDTCHSGGTARGAEVGPRTMARMLAFDPRDIAEAPDTNSDGTPVTAPEDRKDNAVLVLAATQVDQTAKELPDASPPHGVFTIALIDALQALPANIPAIDLWKRVQVDLEVQGFADQQPELDGSKQRKLQPLFGGEAEQGKVRATVVSVDEDGVVLDIGSISDIGPGSEFVPLAQQAGEKVTLQIKAAQGVNRSVAAATPAGAKISPKDVFELSKWVPAEKPAVHFWVPASSLTQAQIVSAVSEARSSGVRLVNDPSLEAWTDLVSWDGSQWTLQKAGVRGAELLGPTLTAGLLQQKIARTGVVWLNVPPPAELASQLLMNNPQSAAQSTSNEAQAMYVLAGMVTDAGPAYAWYNRGELIAGRQTPAGYGAGCSPDSPYPIRTNWVSAANAIEAATTMKESAAKLAKLNGWLQLQSNENGDSDYPYHLALQRTTDGGIAEDKGPSYKGELYQLILQARGDTRNGSRWVYVLAIDCQGKGDLMYPRQGGGNRYPQENGRLEQFPLPGARFHITPPFGTDTYVLLTTSTALANPDALSFESVVRGGERGVSSPLETLLGSTSAGTRGSAGEVPTDWGVEYLQLHSQPKKAADMDAGSKP
jgi:hypothetical protein